MEARTSTDFHNRTVTAYNYHVISLGKKQFAKLFTLVYDGGDGTTDYFTMLSI